MLRHDFKCKACGHQEEVCFESYEEFSREVRCSCGGQAVPIWTKAPGLAGCAEPSTRGVERTFKPGYDIQAGRHFNDRAERDRYLKRRGLMALGPDEFKRSMAAAKVDPEPDYSGLVPAMKEAYEENRAGKVTPHLIVDSKELNPVIAHKET